MSEITNENEESDPDGVCTKRDPETRTVCGGGIYEDGGEVMTEVMSPTGVCDKRGQHYVADWWGGWETPVPYDPSQLEGLEGVDASGN